MSRFKKSLERAERCRVNIVTTITILALFGVVSLKYPLAFLAFLILGLGYAIYRIIKDRKKASTQPRKASESLE